MLLSRIGPIALEGPLGGSADSNVLRGVHLERNMKMAVKLLPPTVEEGFTRVTVLTNTSEPRSD